MQDPGLSLLGSWQNYYIILGTAAATLTGLMFLVISLMAGARVRSSTVYVAIDAFNTPTIVHFCAVLVVALIVSAPWQSILDVSLVLGLANLGGVVYIVTSVPQMRRMEGYQPSRYDWIWYFSVPLALYVIIGIAAVLLLSHPVGALYAISTGALLILFTGLHNAWDLVIFLAVERSHPDDEHRG